MFFRGIQAVRHLGYNETPVHGHYTTVLRKISLSYIRKNSTVSRPQIAKDEGQENGCCCWNFSDIHLPPKYLRVFENVRYAWFALYNRLGGEWILLTTLGIVVAIFSFIMDIIMDKCNTGRMMMFDALTFSAPLQYFVWVLTSIGLVCFATGFTHLVGPFAVGSGIPEVKTIMRGVPLNEYLTLRTLIAKIVGLSTALGSGLPIGKEGPFVHVASISAALLSKLFSCFRKNNEWRNSEILAAACAVGVACTFAAPIGGVLFSIEVTATYFSVKNYWRGFYSAFVGAFMFRFLAIWFHEEVTLTAYFRTNLARGTLFVPGEIIPFSAIGIICGFGGVLFIYTHKRIVLFVRHNRICKSIIRTNRFIYPSLVTLVVLTLFFPSGFGQYMGGMLTNPGAVRELFSNITWHNGVASNYEEAALLNSWRSPLNNVFVTLLFFFVVRFLMCAVATTLPIPAGIFIPSFTLGAGVGRLIGEVLAVCFPDGIGGNAILPGGYAIVGAAAFAGSVTHTVSTVVIAFEMTGQIGHVLPCIVAVLIACIISKRMTLSIFDVIVEIKKLPFIPGFINNTETAHSLTAKEFMVRDVESVTEETTTYRDIEDMLDRFPYRTFPLVKSKENKILLGSIHRHDLDALLNKQLSLENKLNYFSLKNKIKRKTSEAEQKTIADFEHYKGDIIDAADKDNEVIAKDIQKDRADQSIMSNDYDASSEPASAEDMEWLEWQLNQTIDLSLCTVDPAPFQLVDKASLYKVHTMFSLLSLQHAFVTKDGRLVGIISVNEVRSALDRELNSASDERQLKVMDSCKRCCGRNVDDQEDSSKERQAMKANANHK